MDTIVIKVNALRLRAFHGVLPQERVVGNEFEVNIRLHYPAQKAVADDELAATLNYAEVVDEVKRVMATPSELLEHLCGRIRQALVNRFPLISGGSISVAKLSPPIPNIRVGSVEVELSW